jgi:anti-sigma28 factor (negative regulator of flagellin synthesis)
MKVNGRNLEGIRPEQAKPVRETTAESVAKQPAKPDVKPERSDKVQISDAGRAMAESLQPTGAENAAELSPERVAEIRRRLLEGAYESVHVVDEVARRILGRGDV